MLAMMNTKCLKKYIIQKREGVFELLKRITIVKSHTLDQSNNIHISTNWRCYWDLSIPSIMPCSFFPHFGYGIIHCIL